MEEPKSYLLEVTGKDHPKSKEMPLVGPLSVFLFYYSQEASFNCQVAEKGHSLLLKLVMAEVCHLLYSIVTASGLLTLKIYELQISAFWPLVFSVEGLFLFSNLWGDIRLLLLLFFCQQNQFFSLFRDSLSKKITYVIFLKSALLREILDHFSLLYNQSQS